MGREARLRAQGLTTKSEVFIATVKVDSSYEVQKEVDGKKVNEKVSQLFYIPLSKGVNYVSFFNSQAEADEYFRVLANSTDDERSQAILFSKTYSLLSVRYVPNKKGIIHKDWIDKNVKREIPVVLKKYKSSKQL